MISFDTFYPEVKLIAYGAPEPVIDVFLRRAAIEFCTKSRVYTQLTQDFAFKDDGRIYINSLDNDDEQYEAAVKVWYRGTELKVNSADRAIGVHEFAAAKFSADAMRGAPVRAFDVPGERGVIGVYPIPAEKEVDAFTIQVALRPTDACTGLPDILSQDWHDAFVAGVLARLLAVRGQPYSDPSGALIYDRAFRQGIAAARAAASMGSTITGDVQIAMNPFA